MSAGTATQEATASTADAVEHVTDDFSIDTSGVDASEQDSSQENSEVASTPEAMDDLVDVISESLKQVGSDLDVSESHSAIVELSDEDIETIDAWIDDVAAEDADSKSEERDPDWPAVPDVIKQLGIQPKTTRPPAETREQAVSRLQHEMSLRLDELRTAKVEHTDAAEEAKVAKKAMEAAQSALNGVVSRLNDALRGVWQPLLLFSDSDEDASQASNEEEPVAEEPAPETKKDPAIEAPVSQLSLTSSMIGKLEGADIDTIKDLENAMAQDRLRKVSGIGTSAIDKISDAVITWRNQNGYGSSESD